MKRLVMGGIIFILFSMQAMSAETEHGNCGSMAGKVEVGKMGLVDEKTLQKHIERIQNELDAIRRTQPRSSQHRHHMQRHLKEMQAAMGRLHDIQLGQGCASAAHDASMEKRIEVMEQRMNMMQQMVEQMMEHMSEQEK